AVPLARAELEEALARPVRQDADQVAEVRLGVEAMEPSGCFEREEMTEALGVRVAAGEEARRSADGDLSQRALGAVVVEAEAAVLEEAREARLLPDGVVQRGPQQAALGRLRELLGAPAEEVFHVGAQVFVAHPLPLGRG